jgi:hypothetical protein
MYTRSVKSAQSAGSVKTELLNVLRQRIQKVPATFQNKTPFVAVTWKGKTSDRLYIRNGAFENTDLMSLLAGSLGCEGGGATEIVINSVRFAEITENGDGSLNVRMETNQNFNCVFESRRGRAKILFQTMPVTSEGDVYIIREDSFKIFAEGE